MREVCFNLNYNANGRAVIEIHYDITRTMVLPNLVLGKFYIPRLVMNFILIPFWIKILITQTSFSISGNSCMLLLHIWSSTYDIERQWNNTMMRHLMNWGVNEIILNAWILTHLSEQFSFPSQTKLHENPNNLYINACYVLLLNWYGSRVYWYCAVPVYNKTKLNAHQETHDNKPKEYHRRKSLYLP